MISSVKSQPKIYHYSYIYLFILFWHQSGLCFEQSELKQEIGSEQYPKSCNLDLASWSDPNCVIGPITEGRGISSAAFKNLCPKSTGKFEAPSTCDLYITCHHDHLTVNQCPAFMHFNSATKVCVDAQLFECSHPVKNPHEFLEGTKEKRSHFPNNRYQNVPISKINLCDGEGIFPHPYSCSHFIQCGSGRIFEQKCAVGTSFNPKLSICDTSGNSRCYQRGKRSVTLTNSTIIISHAIKKRSPCSSNYIEPHPIFCNKFQTCSNGRVMVQECGPGTLFNPLNKICDDPYHVDCQSRIRDFGTYDCSKGLSYRTSHPEDCKKFIECQNQRIFVKDCPEGTLFDAEKGICDFSQKTRCRPQISLEHDTDVNFLRRSGRLVRDLAQYICEFNYIAPLDSSCKQFIECEGKQLFKKSCGPGTAYNRLIGQCDWPHNVRSPDSEYCSKYLQCDGSKFVRKDCPPGSYFSPQQGKCVQKGNINEICGGKRDNPNYKNPFGSK